MLSFTKYRQLRLPTLRQVLSDVDDSGIRTVFILTVSVYLITTQNVNTAFKICGKKLATKPTILS